MDNKKYHDLFLSAAKEHITHLKNAVGSLREGTSDDKIVEAMHIHAHSLKGECFVMDFHALGKYITILEKYFKRLKDANKTIPAEMFPTVADTVEKIGIFIGEVEQDRKPEVAAEAISELRERLEVTDA